LYIQKFFNDQTQTSPIKNIEIYLCHVLDNFKIGELDEQISSPKLWITMGLCFSEGNSMKLKNEVFYSALAPLAITLWEHFTQAQVILSVIYIK
jgi:hypothetical protein